MLRRRAAQVAISAATTVAGVLGMVSPAQAAGPYWWRNVATGLCLDSNTSGSVYTLTCNGGSFQKWD